jgi:DNA-binding transcriptional LysR family regulator
MTIYDRELRSLLILAEMLHFGKAAARLQISQPALSKQIKGLEQKVGGALLTRNRRDVRLTAAGSFIYQEGKRVIRDLDQLLESARAIATGDAGRLRIGAGLATVHSIVPSALRKFHGAYPHVQAEIRDMSSLRQIDALLGGEVDVGFVRLPVDRPPIEVRIVLRERLTAVASSAFRGPLTLKNLSNQPFIMIGRDISASYYDHCTRLCSSAGFSPRVVQEANDMFTLLNLVRTGMGVALVPGSAMKMRVRGLKFGRIHDREAEWDVGVAWNREEKSVIVNNFVQLCLREPSSRSDVQ